MCMCGCLICVFPFVLTCICPCVCVSVCCYMCNCHDSSKPLFEDMKRRGWMKGDASDWGLYLTFMLTPLIGACTWLAVRPQIPQTPAPEASTNDAD